MTNQCGGTTYRGRRVLHSIIHSELEVLGSTRGDGDSARCGASSFARRANSGRDSPGACRRSLPRKTVYLRQFPTLSVCEISSRGVSNLALRVACSGGRLRADRDTRQVCVTCAAADESNYRHHEKRHVLHSVTPRVKMRCICCEFVSNSMLYSDFEKLPPHQ